MPLYYPGCDVTIVKPLCSDCPDKELGDVRGLALIAEGFVFTDPTAAAEWNTGIAASDIYVFPYTRGGLEDTEHEVAGYGDTNTEVDGYDYVLTAFEPNYVNDWAFWDSIRASKNYRVAYRSESRLHIADNNCSIIVKQPIAADEKRQAIVWNVIFKWTQEGKHRPYAQPTGIFDRCLDI